MAKEEDNLGLSIFEQKQLRRVIEKDIGASVVSQENHLTSKKVNSNRRGDQKRLLRREPSLFDEPVETDD